MAQTGPESRLNMRVAPDQKALIEQAASARGLDVTAFVLSAAVREAEMALTERTYFVLDAENYDRFLALLDRPVQEKPEVAALRERVKMGKWIVNE